MDEEEKEEEMEDSIKAASVTGTYKYVFLVRPHSLWNHNLHIYHQYFVVVFKCLRAHQ